MDANKDTTDPLINAVRPDASYRELLKIARFLRSQAKKLAVNETLPGMVATRVALVANSTLSFLTDPLTAKLAGRGVHASILTGGYDGYLHELLDANSAILASRPDFVIVHLDHHAIQEFPGVDATADACHELATRQVSLWRKLWHHAHEASGCSIIQTNIAIPVERAMGSCESTNPSGRIYFLREINRILNESLPPYVTLCDVEHLSSVIGKRKWFDLPHWYASRQAVEFDSLGALADTLAAAIASQLGRGRKCLVLDLDNTLWGGVVGDVGRENLRLQRGDSVGDSHLDFQSYCLRLKQRGVLLAICSKNEESIARDVFEQHPDMILKLADISVFMANWEDKATNLKRIASRLNIGLDSLVFVDDHPAERELVRQLAPAVAVPEMPEDPALYARVLDSYAYFETTRLSSEDIARADQYTAQRARGEAEAEFTDINAFLTSLEQKCTIRSVDANSLPRVVQLLNKTNQFNLTNTRRTQGEVEKWLRDENHFTGCVRHVDRFGDNGIISVFHGRIESDELALEDWVMSCRVFKRGIEFCVFNAIVEAGIEWGMRTLRGQFRATDRNHVIADLYRRCGCRLEQTSDEDAIQTWRLANLNNHEFISHTIACDVQLCRGGDFSDSYIFSKSIDNAQKEQKHGSRVA